MPKQTGLAGLFAWVTLAGACTMAVELSAVRLVAPWFGTSAAVWTNVIGVILLALAAGYLLGARLTAGPTPEQRLGLVLLGAALFTAWLPGLAAPVCSWFMPSGLGLDQAAALFLWGSLAATLLLFLAPALCLGCVGPLAVEIVARKSGASAGSAGGQILCVSTLGSLAGTFGTTHVLLPSLGVTWTLMGAGAVLALGAAWMLVSARAARPPLLLLAVGMLAAALGSRVAAPDLPPGRRLLERGESPYQSLRVVSESAGDGRELRLLQVDEGLDSFQSVWVPEPGLIGEGFYYDYFALPAWWSGAGAGDPWRVCVLGLGSGTTFRVLEGASPEGVALDLVGVEIDSKAVELGQRWFDLRPQDPGRTVLSGRDARASLRGLLPGFDLAVLDAYAHQVEIPAHLSSLEFLREVRGKLTDGGWLAINVGGFGFEDPVVEAVAATAAAAFERGVLVLRVPMARNFIVFARRDAAPPRPGEGGFAPDGAPRELLGPAVLPSGWRWVEPTGGVVLTDDKNPLDRLQRRSLEAASASLAKGAP
jgi:spermidine synthase